MNLGALPLVIHLVIGSTIEFPLYAFRIFHEQLYRPKMC
jgi:hypothetical protein